MYESYKINSSLPERSSQPQDHAPSQTSRLTHFHPILDTGGEFAHFASESSYIVPLMAKVTRPVSALSCFPGSHFENNLQSEEWQAKQTERQHLSFVENAAQPSST
jgi:hypothetical protein